MADKERQHKLAAVIKGVHSKLRKKYKADKETFDEAWNEHCQNDELLSEYASAMVQLATDVWVSTKKETRIDWCVSVCQDFFGNCGLEKAIAKDKRRWRFHDKSSETCNATVENQDSGTTNKEIEKDSHLTTTEVYLPVKEKIRLLDVGSCYNPFEGYPDFLSVGIDLSPAVESVLRCDFLKLQLSESQPECIDSYLQHLSQPVTSLPSCTFHVIVFSLLLEYLPSVEQRWLCCEKAHKLLLKNGILIIITPDSNHQNKNAPMMKCWKLAIESLGFSRWRYVKQEHLHCMAFRKTSYVSENVLEGAKDMLHIPQDTSETPGEDTFLGNSNSCDRIGSYETLGADELDELPFSDGFDLFL